MNGDPLFPTIMGSHWRESLKRSRAERNTVSDNIWDRIKALQTKAALKQAAVDACQGHIWHYDYVSKFDQEHGSSAVCVRCGERRGWKDIKPNEPSILTK